MNTVTIACPQGLSDPNIDSKTAPIWTDGVNYYHVSSGFLLVDGGEFAPYVTSDPIQAAPDRVNVVVGMSGLDALSAMGLTVKLVDEE